MKTVVGDKTKDFEIGIVVRDLHVFFTFRPRTPSFLPMQVERFRSGTLPPRNCLVIRPTRLLV